jgi:hypothetical protein
MRNPFSVAQKYLEADGHLPERRSATADLPDGPIIAVLIDSPIVGPVWFAFDEDFKSGDKIPVFFASELLFLGKRDPEELRRRYDEKRSLGGGWIRGRKEN